jgi:hypothetical protein
MVVFLSGPGSWCGSGGWCSAGLVPPGPPLQGLQPLKPLQGGQQGVGQAAGPPFPPVAQQQGFCPVGQAAFSLMGADAQQQGYGAASQAAFYPPFGYGQYAPGGYRFPGQQWPGYYPPFPEQVQAAPAAAPAADVNLDAIVQLLKTAPPRLLAEAAGGRFAVDIDGNVLVVARARSTEEYLSAT